MAHSDRLRPSPPPTFPDEDLETVDIITKKLNIHNPYRGYPPCGVPCPEGSNTFHLALRREKWWQMLQEHAWREKVVMEKMRIEDERKERLRQMWQKEEEEAKAAEEIEQKKQRKDSLVVEEKDVEYANTGDGSGADAATSAICSSSEEGNDEVPPEQTKDIKGRKKSADKGKGKAYVHEHKVRRAKPLSGVRTHARQGSVASCSSSKTPS